MLISVVLTACNAGQQPVQDNVSDITIQNNPDQNNPEEAEISGENEVDNNQTTETSDKIQEDNTPVSDEALIEQIKNGDFSKVKNEDTMKLLENLHIAVTETQRLELVECELNKNRLKGLVFQEKESFPDSIEKRIEAILAIQNGEAVLVYKHSGQMTNFFFLGENGNFINYYQSYGTVLANSYSYYTFDTEYSEEFVYSLDLYYIEDIEGVPEKSRNGRVEGVIYYTKVTIEDNDWEKMHEEPLTEEQFLEAFEEMTGSSFYDLEPDWYDVIER